MKKFVFIAALGFALWLIILCLPPPGKGQDWGAYGLQVTEQPVNWHYVYFDGELSQAVAKAVSGDGILVFADTLTEELGSLSKKLYFKSAYPMGDTTGGTVWDVTAEAFTLKNGSQGTVIEGFEIINRTNTDSLFDASDLHYILRNCILDGSKLVCAGDKAQSSRAFPYWENVKIYPRANRGFSVINDTLWCVNLQVGEPLGYDNNTTYGVYVHGTPSVATLHDALWHCRGKTNIYAQGNPVACDSDGVFCAYDGAIIAVTKDLAYSAVTCSTGGAFTCYGGEILNNDASLATIRVVDDSSSVNIERCVIKNKDGAGAAYNSKGDSVSTLLENIWGGPLSAWCTIDVISFETIFWGPDTIKDVDSVMIWHNATGRTVYLESIYAYSSADDDTILLREKTAAAAWVSSVDTAYCITERIASKLYSSTEAVYADIDDASISAGNTIWAVNDSDAVHDQITIGIRYIVSSIETARGGD